MKGRGGHRGLPCALTLAVALAGCSSTGTSSGSGSSQPSGGCDTNYQRLAGHAPVSFEQELMPLFGRSCVMSQCHNVRDERAGLYLGPRCEATASACVFPSSPSGPDPVRDPQPLTAEITSRVHAELVAESSTVSGVPRVTPGAPNRSFLLDKLAGQESERGYACSFQPQSTSDDPCGGGMPLGAVLCAQADGGQALFDTVAAWVVQGAPP